MKHKSETDHKKVVVKQFNLIFGSKNGTRTFWTNELPKKINEKFIGANITYVSHILFFSYERAFFIFIIFFDFSHFFPGFFFF
jgi:hypothetical protein